MAAETREAFTRLRPDDLARMVWDSDAFWTGRAMLDALIQLRQPMPAEFLQALGRPFPTEAAILMLQNAAGNREGLFALRTGNPRGSEWTAATNALAAMRAPGLAAALIREVTFSNRVVVSDDGRVIPAGMAGSVMSGNLRMRLPAGFPKVGCYRITSLNVEDDELIAGGETNMYAHRTLFEPGTDMAWEQVPEGYCYQCLRIGYLAELAGVPLAEAQSAIERETGVKWSSASALRAEVSRSVERQIADLRGLHAALIAAGSMNDTEIDSPLTISIAVEDGRRDPTKELPAFAAASFRLR